MPIRIIPGTPPHDVWITCDQCDAMWLGQPFDECEWCTSIGEDIAIRERDALLFPEWIGWNHRYRDLSPIDRKVWEATRGIHGDYIRNWQRRIFNALTHNVITGHEAKLALERNSKWMKTHLPKSGG
jgi:hypothetical protein